jgi:hypothetical protein
MKLREWTPFVIDSEAMMIAENLAKGGERCNVRPSKLRGRKYFVIPYARSWSWSRMQPSGYLLLDHKHKMLDDYDTCTKLIATFRVWRIIYFYPARKHTPFIRKKLSRMTNKTLNKIYEDCKHRLAMNEYQRTEDPVVLHLNEAIRKLDQNVVTSYELIKKHHSLLQRTAETEKAIWQDPSFERVEAYATTLLPALKNTNEAMLSYLRERVNLTYESMKALREYESELMLTKVRRIAVDVLAVIAALYYPVYGIAVKLLDEASKIIWADFTGYKGLLRQMEELRRMQPRIDRIIDAFHSPVARELIRNF